MVTSGIKSAELPKNSVKFFEQMFPQKNYMQLMNTLGMKLKQKKTSIGTDRHIKAIQMSSLRKKASQFFQRFSKLVSSDIKSQFALEEALSQSPLNCFLKTTEQLLSIVILQPFSILIKNCYWMIVS